MQNFLIYTLAASLGSFGELAGHERRGGLLWPARSALTGMMGAALGIRRDGDFTSLDGLEISVGIYDSGVFLRDYHTVQTIPSAVVRQPNSRPEALRAAGSRSNTTITLRDYRSGPLFGVVVQGEGLEAIATALNAPVFTLYLGRKSCPLACPTGARVVQAQDPVQALSHLVLPPWRQEARLQSLVVDDPAGGDIVYDRVIDRKHWHFGSRRVSVQAVDRGDVQ